MRNHILCFTIILSVFCLHSPAQANCALGIAQNPALATQFDMGSNQSIIYTITNSNTAPDAGRSITVLRFRMTGACSGAGCTNTVFRTGAGAQTCPAGWNLTSTTTTTVTCTAAAAANYITQGNSNAFTLNFTMGRSSADRNETLRDIRATYSGGNCSNTGSTRFTVNTPGSWTLKSLSITLFQTTDCAGTPISALTSGNNFCVVMTVKNNSSVTQNGIVSNPTNPPSGANISKTGTVTQGYISTTNNPNPLNLAVGASGTITFRYSTVGTDEGTIQFVNLNARTGATVTSSNANSNILTVSRLTVGIAVKGPVAGNPKCVFSGDTATFTMTVTNNTGAAVNNVKPSALNGFGTATIGAFTGPTPSACIASIANGGTGTFIWTATVTGTPPPKRTFWVEGTVNYNMTAGCASGGTTSVTGKSDITEDVDGYTVVPAPATTYANSTNEELTWTVTNYGCADINSVAIAIPGGWTYGGDSYSFIDPTGLAIETWVPSGTVTFTADAPGNRIAASSNRAGEFHLVFSQTPSATGANTFNVVITDASATPNITTVPTTVTVNAFDNSIPGSGNYTLPKVWRESY